MNNIFEYYEYTLFSNGGKVLEIYSFGYFESIFKQMQNQISI